MIVLRTKNYSTKRLQALRSIIKAGDNAITKMDNRLLKVGRGVKNAFVPITPGKVLPPEVRLTSKSPTQLNRSVIKTKRILKDTLDKATSTGNNVMNSRVGEAVDKGIESSIRRPDVALVAGASQLTTPAGIAIGGPVGSALILPGWSSAIPVVSQRPIIPKKGLDRLSKKADQYVKSGFSKRLRDRKTTIGDIVDKVSSLSTQVPLVSM